MDVLIFIRTDAEELLSNRMSTTGKFSYILHTPNHFNPTHTLKTTR